MYAILRLFILVHDSTFIEMLIGTPAENGALMPGAITETDNMLVLLSMVMIGVLIGLLVKSGASRATRIRCC